MSVMGDPLLALVTALRDASNAVDDLKDLWPWSVEDSADLRAADELIDRATRHVHRFVERGQLTERSDGR